ncbi:hypothetical protein HAX54_041121, partial [Datura stramonium]|nr:hypothetical protein [Datura stramonium]
METYYNQESGPLKWRLDLRSTLSRWTSLISMTNSKFVIGSLSQCLWTPTSRNWCGNFYEVRKCITPEDINSIYWADAYEVRKCITPEDINSIYWADTVRLSLENLRKLADKENQFAWVANIIAKCQSQWEEFKGEIHRHDLIFEAKMWLYL